jgi:hypothetical protein
MSGGLDSVRLRGGGTTPGTGRYHHPSSLKKDARRRAPTGLPEPLPAPYSAETDSPILGNGKSGPKALSANAPAFPQASRNEPRASLLAT